MKYVLSFPLKVNCVNWKYKIRISSSNYCESFKSWCHTDATSRLLIQSDWFICSRERSVIQRARPSRSRLIENPTVLLMVPMSRFHKHTNLVTNRKRHLDPSHSQAGQRTTATWYSINHLFHQSNASARAASGCVVVFALIARGKINYWSYI